MKKMIILTTVLFSLLLLISCGKLEWPDTKLGKMIPTIKDAKGEVGYEDADSLNINLEGISLSQYYDYIEACKEKGFTVDAIEESNSFVAFTADGYKIEVSYFSTQDLWITIDLPIAMSNFSWPKSNIAKLIPTPKSNYGKIEWEADYGFVIYVGNTTKSEYLEYIDLVYDCGFNVDYDRGDNFFYADNIDGYSVSIKYEGNNTMFVRIDDPDDDASTDSSNNTSNNNNSNNTNNDTNNNSNNVVLIDGMRPEFKEAMDSYEDFFDEYCAFMTSFNSSSNTANMMNEYLDFLSQYTETMDKFEKIDETELNSAELLYYTEVVSRVNQKLLEIS